MLISIENADDFKKFAEIVELFIKQHDNHKKEIDVFVERTGDLRSQLVDKDETINTHICEINKLSGKLDDLQKEIKCLSTLNSELSKEIERLKAQHVSRDSVFDDLRAELKATIEENESLKKELGYYEKSTE